MHKRPAQLAKSRSLAQEVAQAIEPINIAGLADPQRNNWYPVDAQDLLNGAGKLKATEEEVDALLVRAVSTKSLSALSCGVLSSGISALISYT